MSTRLGAFAGERRSVLADYLAHGVYGSVIALAVVAVLAASKPPPREGSSP